MLERRPDPAGGSCDCQLCRALLGLAESAIANRAAAERRRATIHVVDEDHQEDATSHGGTRLTTRDDIARVSREADRAIRLGGWRNFELGVTHNPDADEPWIINFRLEEEPFGSGLEVEVRGRSDDHALGALRARLHAIGRPAGG